MALDPRESGETGDGRAIAVGRATVVVGRTAGTRARRAHRGAVPRSSRAARRARTTHRATSPDRPAGPESQLPPFSRHADTAAGPRRRWGANSGCAYGDGC